MPQRQPEQPGPRPAQPSNPYMDTIMEILNDPHNQMMFAPGMSLLRAPGAISQAFKLIPSMTERGSLPMGYGAELLRRYKLLGGTPETLNKTLEQRPIPPGPRHEIVEGYRKATDLAAPRGWTNVDGYTSVTPGERQNDTMNLAGKAFEIFGYGPRKFRHPNLLRTQSDIPVREDWYDATSAVGPPNIESGTRGNAAYGAVSHQVERMLSDPGFKQARPKYGPPAGKR